MTVIALIGNPNCGKTTVFNALTGARQRVGNWPGVTVERKTGHFEHADERVEVVDLPGTYSILDADATDAVDERIARDFVHSAKADLIVNVVDASSLERGLYLTTQVIGIGKPVVVALNMIDVADKHGLHIDPVELGRRLGCPVVPMIASRQDGVGILKDLTQSAQPVTAPLPTDATSAERYALIDAIVAETVRKTPVRHSATDMIDAVVLNRFLAFPIFLLVIYLMFMFTINVGSAFIDFFDLAGSALFVEGPRQLYEAIGLPEWLSAFLADGVGGGVQLVGTFIPVIGCLFLVLAFLEDSGYMGRVAFVLDRAMQGLGLPGKSFVPLIVGFGCNVPAVMATRSLDNQPDRILTTIMAPYMSCGARLTVYALFAAAFFPSNGQNIVFALYLIGIAFAVGSAFLVRRFLLKQAKTSFVMELPPYHLPTLRGMLIHTWQRLKGFVTRAGKAIVAVVIVLNVVNSVGTDGSFGNQDSNDSVLSAIGRAITPVFHPIGVDDDNWPATVGIFTGIFAKEVVVGTLDALYSPNTGQSNETFELGPALAAALATIPANLETLGATLGDPLGIGVGEIGDTDAAAADQEVAISTITVMQDLFHGQLGAFSYLLFILLYMPCVATIGVIYKEQGAFWAVFSTTWSVLMAYGAAVLFFQLGNFDKNPTGALLWLAAVVASVTAAFLLLVRLGKRHLRQEQLIPVVQLH